MLIPITLFIFGLVFGSFYNVVGLRVPNNESIVYPGSHCPRCEHELTALQLIPVISYIFLRGKCSNCQSPVSAIYPLMEFITGALFFLAAYKLGVTAELIVALTLISLLVIITVSDLTYMLIPNKILLFFTGLFIVERIFLPLTPWWDSLLGASLGFTLLLIIAVVSRGGMGGGDIKLYALIGFVIGTKSMLLSFFLATLFGALYGTIGLATKKLERKKPIPFGPFIAIATIISYFYGEKLLFLYLDTFIF